MTKGVTIIRHGNRYIYDCACAGLVQSVKRAASRTAPDWIPYYGEVTERAVWNAKYVYREARRLGLYPCLSLLEAETQNAGAA